MPRSQRDTHRRVTAGVGCATALAAGFLLFPLKVVHAQDRPPLLEPMALEGTMKQFYRGANVVIVTTMDGVEHVYQFTKNLIYFVFVFSFAMLRLWITLTILTLGLKQSYVHAD